jgi:hypothetical protein
MCQSSRYQRRSHERAKVVPGWVAIASEVIIGLPKTTI